jgi:hypothetical protein
MKRILVLFAREHGPGRYDVDEHSLDPFPGSNVTAGAWGKVMHDKDGQVDHLAGKRLAADVLLRRRLPGLQIPYR